MSVDKDKLSVALNMQVGSVIWPFSDICRLSIYLNSKVQGKCQHVSQPHNGDVMVSTFYVCSDKTGC